MHLYLSPNDVGRDFTVVLHDEQPGPIRPLISALGTPTGSISAKLVLRRGSLHLYLDIEGGVAYFCVVRDVDLEPAVPGLRVLVPVDFTSHH